MNEHLDTIPVIPKSQYLKISKQFSTAKQILDNLIFDKKYFYIQQFKETI